AGLRQMTERVSRPVPATASGLYSTLVNARPRGLASAPIRISARSGAASLNVMLATFDQAAKAARSSPSKAGRAMPLAASRPATGAIAGQLRAPAKVIGEVATA